LLEGDQRIEQGEDLEGVLFGVDPAADDPLG
jgi:hypothetical protein